VTTSASVDFSVNRDNIIRQAMLDAQVIGIDQTATDLEISDCARKLQMLVKQWQGRADFGANLKVWARKTAYLFLQQGQSVYSVGPSGDNWTGSYSTTTLAAAKLASATGITLASAIGANADIIGIVLDSGAIGWTTISSGGATTTPTLAANSLGAASSGARVFTYTSKARRPLPGLLSAVLRDTSNQDTVLPVNKTRQDYEAVGDKTADGTPLWLAYEATLTNGTIYLSSEPNDVTKVIRVVFLGTQEDFDAAADTPDYPQEWYRALVAQLAIDICPMFGRAVTAEMKLARDEALSIALNTDPETSDVFFEPGRD
jgi:hypothetical protein